jgi:hypothetical protein
VRYSLKGYDAILPERPSTTYLTNIRPSSGRAVRV